jgi:ketosteroid isomerase-like protein
MTYYAPNVVSMQEGTKMARGTNAVRAAYVEMVKTPMQNPQITMGDVDFSADGTMAYDHGSFSATMNGPNGKPMKVGGNYLNVWKNAGGRWLMVAEMSNSDQGM